MSSQLIGRSLAWLQQALGRAYRAVFGSVRFFILNAIHSRIRWISQLLCGILARPPIPQLFYNILFYSREVQLWIIAAVCFYKLNIERKFFMTEKMECPPETRTYYCVESNNQQDCELAIKKAIALASSTDKKITLLVDKYDYEMGFEDNVAIQNIVKVAKLNNDDGITCCYGGCHFNLFIRDVAQNEIFDTVLVYGSTCGDAMRSAYESYAQNIILIPTYKEEWEFFIKAMQLELID